MINTTTEKANKDISDLQSDLLYDNFEHFFSSLNTQFYGYHSKYVSSNYNIPRNLQLSIDNYSHFVDTFKALVHSKLYIKCIKNYDKDRMFYRYILPTSVFLHYMHVDMSKLSEIYIYIVNEKLYSLYRNEVGGEYTQGIKARSKKNAHIILIKEYTDNDKTNDALTLVSLFHELTHLVDNSDFNGLRYDQIIGYPFRSTEIKAKHLSEFFWAFYECLLRYVHKFYKYHVITEYNISLKENLNDLYLSIVNNLEMNDAIINTSILVDEITDRTIELTQKNIQYYTSLQQIYELTKFFKDVEGILE